MEWAVDAMRRGVRDFIQKPWENQRLLAILRTQLERRRALQRLAAGRAAQKIAFFVPGDVLNSSHARRRCSRNLRPLLALAPQTNALITGDQRQR